jgi:hypothetical protein
MLCNGTVQPSLSAVCGPSEEPWVIESGSRAILLAGFAAGRNYFDGRVVTQSGVRKSVGPFYSAAAVDDGAATSWLLAQLDGRTEIVDASLEPAGNIPAWGSDIVGLDARCAGTSPVLATRPGDATEADSVQAFALVNRSPMPLSPAVTFPGPVTALWPVASASALAVAHDLASGIYTAYVLSLACGA